MKETQCQRVLDYLRAHRKATNMTLTVGLRIGCPWKRIAELTGIDGKVYEEDPWGMARSTGERITRERVKTAGGAYVTMYTLHKR